MKKIKMWCSFLENGSNLSAKRTCNKSGLKPPTKSL